MCERGRDDIEGRGCQVPCEIMDMRLSIACDPLVSWEREVRRREETHGTPALLLWLLLVAIPDDVRADESSDDEDGDCDGRSDDLARDSSSFRICNRLDGGATRGGE